LGHQIQKTIITSFAAVVERRVQRSPARDEGTLRLWGANSFNETAVLLAPPPKQSAFSA
jgi:hypothetical protein